MAIRHAAAIGRSAAIASVPDIARSVARVVARLERIVRGAIGDAGELRQ
jgi:hypothetical protein